MKYGGIEMGGTKMVCAIVDEEFNILDRKTIPTTTPEETLSLLVDYFKDKDVDAIGLASFGPVDLNENSKTYGYITETPKPGWRNTDVVGYFKKHFNIPIGFDTDVNAACLGEVIYGAGKGLSNVIYGTIGTGIGFGVYLNDKLHHGLMHPETGHILLRQREDDKYLGCCPYHKGCFEGLASGTSMFERWGRRAETMDKNDKAFELEAFYIAQGLLNCVMCYSPEKIILGGGVMHNENLYPMIRKELLKQLNGYIAKDEILKDIDNYVVKPMLNDNQGIIGACELGRLKLTNE